MYETRVLRSLWIEGRPATPSPRDEGKGGSDAETNRITLCTSCQDKLHQHRYGAHKHSQRIKTAFAARRARGASIGRPKKLMPDERKEALQRLDWRVTG